MSDTAHSPIVGLPALRDNYIWMLPTGPKSVAAVDPGDPMPVSHYLKQNGLTLTHILLTHHHEDHTAGSTPLAACHGAQVIGSQIESLMPRLPPLDHPVQDGDRLQLGDCPVQVLAVPGHTLGHVAYLTHHGLFPGDTLFSFGCGRLFEGDPATMWASLLKLRHLPAATRVFPAHEYTRINLEFAQHLEPNRPEWPSLLQETDTARSNNLPTLPRTLAEQQQLNPFLRCDDPQFAAILGLANASPVQVFAKLRSDRDRF